MTGRVEARRPKEDAFTAAGFAGVPGPRHCRSSARRAPGLGGRIGGFGAGVPGEVGKVGGRCEVGGGTFA